MPFRSKRLPDGVSEWAERSALEILGNIQQWDTDVPVKRRRLLQARELKLLSHLRNAHPTSHILCQVQMIQLANIDVDAMVQEWGRDGSNPYSFPNSKAAIASINLLSIDFVITDSNGVPYFAIELDGPGHDVNLDRILRWMLESEQQVNWNVMTQQFLHRSGR